MRFTGGDGTAWTIHACRRAPLGALASILVLATIVLAGCTPRDVGSMGSTEIEGGVGLSGPGDDGAASPIQVSLDGGTTADSGTDHAAATIDSGPGGHEICSQSWSVLANDPSDPTMGVAQAGTRMLALDGVGDMYVAASFTGAVNVAGQTFQSAGSGAESLLVVKVDPACRVLWAKAFGAPQADVQVAGVAVDAAGNVVVAGQLAGAQVDFGSGPVGSLVSPRPGAFVFKLGTDGTGLWSHAYLASAGSFLISGYVVGAIDVAVDSHGNTVFAEFSATGSPSWTPPGAIPGAARGPQDPGLGTVNANPWWAAWPGGRLAVDPSGRALVSSAFAGSADFDSVGSLTSHGGLDSAVLRFDAQGHLIGGQRWGGAEDDLPVDVAADAAGDAVIAGWTVPPVALDAGSGVSQSSASYAIFVAKLGW